MDLSGWADFAEIVGALAIVVSLVYVGIELRQNTRSTRASTSYEGAHSWADMNSIAMGNPSLATAIKRSLYEDSPTLSEEEATQLYFVGRALMERLDGLFYLYRNKQLEGELWQIRVTWARRWLDRPFWRDWWQQEKLTSNYSPSFLQELESQASDGGPV